MASDLAGDDLLDRCYCYLEEKGFGILELARLDPKDATEVAKQIAFELNVPLREHLEGAVKDCFAALRVSMGTIWSGDRYTHPSEPPPLIRNR